MKRIRTEIHVTVATYVGEDVSLDGRKPLSRTPDAVDAISVSRIETLDGVVPVAMVTGGHIAAMMAKTAPVLVERMSFATRKLLNT